MVYDLTPILKGETKSISELEMISLLVSLSYEKKEKMKEQADLVLKNYCYFLKPYFKSLSLSPFEEDISRETLTLSMIQSFVLFTAEKEKAISSILLSIRYFLSLI